MDTQHVKTFEQEQAVAAAAMAATGKGGGPPGYTPFNRERDLAITPKLSLTAAQDLIGKAAGMGGRFAKASTERNFL